MPAFVYTRDSDVGWLRVLNSNQVQRVLQDKAHELNTLARNAYRAQSKNEDDPPIFYQFSFGIRHTHHDSLVKSVVAFNNDPVAKFVEFGGKGGEHHTTPILKYRPYGIAMDMLEIAARVGHIA
jgi:hypothetical protein